MKFAFMAAYVVSGLAATVGAATVVMIMTMFVNPVSLSGHCSSLRAYATGEYKNKWRFFFTDFCC